MPPAPYFRKRLLTLLLLLFLPLTAAAKLGIAPHHNVKTVAPQVYAPIDHFHHAVFWACSATIVFFFALIFFTLFKQRHAAQYPCHPHSHLGIEIAWAITPFLILMVMTIPATQIILQSYQHTPATHLIAKKTIHPKLHS